MTADGLLIRDATDDDWPAVWPFFHRIVAAGETHCWPADLPSERARLEWLSGERTTVLVALGEQRGAARILGTASIHPTRAGNGAHVANGSFMVDPAASGRGVGRTLGEAALARARAEGYRAMQFNAVVESNTGAIALWRSLGFEIIGTAPGAFHHPRDGYVGLHIMYQRL
jgi:L-amino acid N-acyltransferase YncA